MRAVNAIALKEWAVAINALEAGDQIIILRKGGIIEETRDFQVESQAFFLFPTYEHQKSHLLKDAYQPRLDLILSETVSQPSHISLTSYAEVVKDIEVNSQDELNQLYPYHIWTEHFAEERLKWKREKPLHVLILRVYKLDKPFVIPMLDEYNGCKSWIRLNVELPAEMHMKPALSPEDFAAQSSQIADQTA